jgi:hypothetical protein
MAIEVFQDETSFPRPAALQQQRGAFGETCCNEPRPTPAFPQRLCLAEQQSCKVTLLPLLGDPRQHYVCA